MMRTQVKELVAERQRLLAESRRLFAKAKELEHRIDEARRYELQTFLGRPVRFCGTVEPGSRWAWLDGAVGTLVSIKRTRCSVGFGPRGEVTMPIADVEPIAEGELVAEG